MLYSAGYVVSCVDRRWLIVNKGGDVKKINDNGPLQFLLYAITITVVSIPEGLPLAVTLTLAYSVRSGIPG